jgi:hypothetical protein
VLTSAQHLSVSSARTTQSTYPPIPFLEDQCWGYLPVHPMAFFPSGFTTKPSTHISPIRTCQTPTPHFVTCIIHIMQLHTMQSAAVSSYRILSGPNISLSTLFLNTLCLCSSLHIRHQASYSIKQ